MEIKQTRFLIITGAILLFIVLSLIIYLNIQSQDNIVLEETDEEVFVPQSTITALPPTPTDIPLQFTGDSDEDSLSDDTKKQINTSFDLITKLPIETNDFLLSYDYNLMKFLVKFKNIQVFGEPQFQQWLNDNGYGQIPNTDFITE